MRLGYAESRQVEIFNSQGRAASDDRTRVRLSAQVVARRGDRVETGTRHPRRDMPGLRAGRTRPGKEAAELAARRALTLLDAVDAPTGRLPAWSATALAGCCCMRRWAMGSRRTPSRRERSVYAGRIGDELCPAFVTAYDDGGATRGRVGE